MNRRGIQDHAWSYRRIRITLLALWTVFHLPDQLASVGDGISIFVLVQDRRVDNQFREVMEGIVGGDHVSDGSRNRLASTRTCVKAVATVVLRGSIEDVLSHYGFLIIEVVVDMQKLLCVRVNRSKESIVLFKRRLSVMNLRMRASKSSPLEARW